MRPVLLVLMMVLMMFLTTVALCAQRQKMTTVYSEYFTSYDSDSTVPNVTLLRHKHKETHPHTERSPRGMQLLGRFEKGEKVILELANLPEHEKLQISIGFHIIGAWEGEEDGDRFEVVIHSDTVFNHSFSNTVYQQSYPGAYPDRLYPPRTASRNSNMLAYRYVEPGVYDGLMDATYMDDFVIDHSESTVRIEFTAYINGKDHGIEKESWGMEHIKVIAVGPEPPPDMAPAYHVHEPVYDEEIVEFAGTDIRAVAGYVQDGDLPGLVPGSPWEDLVHSTVVSNRYMRCGDICLFYTYAIYNDAWVNVWVNREMGGNAMWSTTLTSNELDSIRQAVEACMSGGEPVVEFAAEDADMHPDLPHYELHLRTLDRERMVSVNGGEPPEITALTETVLKILARHGWEPSPFSWD